MFGPPGPFPTTSLYLSLSDLVDSAQTLKVAHVLARLSSLCQIIFLLWTHTSQLHPFTRQRTIRRPPSPGRCKQCCDAHGAHTAFELGFWFPSDRPQSGVAGSRDGSVLGLFGILHTGFRGSRPIYLPATERAGALSPHRATWPATFLGQGSNLSHRSDKAESLTARPPGHLSLVFWGQPS